MSTCLYYLFIANYITSPNSGPLIFFRPVFFIDRSNKTKRFCTGLPYWYPPLAGSCVCDYRKINKHKLFLGHFCQSRTIDLRYSEKRCTLVSFFFRRADGKTDKEFTVPCSINLQLETAKVERVDIIGRDRWQTNNTTFLSLESLHA